MPDSLIARATLFSVPQKGSLESPLMVDERRRLLRCRTGSSQTQCHLPSAHRLQSMTAWLFLAPSTNLLCMYVHTLIYNDTYSSAATDPALWRGTDSASSGSICQSKLSHQDSTKIVGSRSAAKPTMFFRAGRQLLLLACGPQRGTHTLSQSPSVQITSAFSRISSPPRPLASFYKRAPPTPRSNAETKV